MQVAHRDDYDTHAVIGGKGVQEFGIAQTAEFFTVLSNTLYSNKPLAVIREVLCNAWDSHIVAGKTDTPVIVTIDEDKLSIRDHGHGIPHDMIHQIYCIYGNSTKENDGNQTGGFGLGSKSPFAYSDHFTVNNHHAMLKTVHAISRGSALTQGKPDRRVMVSVPTMETGVEVVIPVKSKTDMHHFIEITKDIAAFGEMNVILNGKQVEVVPISTAENNMFLTTRAPRGVHNKICIRYGNVVYPVQPDAEYIGSYQRLMKLLENIPAKNKYSHDNEFHLIMQAPANSISVTPSRESLSNTETTVRTLKKLFAAMIDHMQTGSALFLEKLLEEQQKAADFIIQKGKMDRIYFSENLLNDSFGPKTINDGSSVWSQITNMTQLADYYLRYKTSISARTQLKLEEQRVEILLKNGARQPYKLRLFQKLKRKGYFEGDFRKKILKPLLRHVAKNEVLNHKHLYVVKPAFRTSRYSWTDFSKYTPDAEEFLPLLQGVVIVTHNKIAYEEDWNSVTDLQNTIPNSQPRIVYVAPRTKGHKEAAVEQFKKLGYLVIDFATMLDEYRAAHAEHKEKGPVSLPKARQKKEGLVLLQNNINKNGVFVRALHLNENAKRSTEYDYVIRPHNLSPKYGTSKSFFPWGERFAKEIVSLFGSKIAICVNDPQMESQLKKGKKDGILFITQQIADRVMTSPHIRAHVEGKKGLKRTEPHFQEFLEMAEYSSVLQKAFGLKTKINSEDDLLYYEIFQMMAETFHRYSIPRPKDGEWLQPIWDANEAIKSWPADQTYVHLNDIIKKSTGIGYLDIYDMSRDLRDMSKTNPDYQRKVFIESTIINALAF